MPASMPLTSDALDRLLLAVPLHVLCFDSALVCWYAAPCGDSGLLGRNADALLGLHAEEVFPASTPIAPALQRVLDRGAVETHAQVPYPAGPGGARPAGAWDVQVQPWAVDDRAAEPATRSVAVSCIERQPEDATPAALSVDELARQRERTNLFLERLRTQLTVVRGFTTLLRRQELRHLPLDAPLTQIEHAAAALSELVTAYELTMALAMRGPALRRAHQR